MIINMSRVSLVLASDQQEAALTKLAETALFHVGTLDHHNETIAELQRRMAHAELMLRHLPEKTTLTQEQKSHQELEPILKQIESLSQEQVDLSKSVQEYTRYLEQYAAWGNFSLEDLAFLAAEGHHIRLYQVDARTYKQMQAENAIPIYLCKILKGAYYLAAYSVEESKFPSQSAIELPPLSPEQMQQHVSQALKRIEEINAALAKLAVYREAITKLVADIEESILFERTASSLRSEGEIAVLQGFVPTEDLNDLKENAQNHGWALLIEEAITGDEDADALIPTKIKPSFFGKFSLPILQGLDFTPGYQEMDISGVMFFFFAIFFSMIVGDAAYGAIFLVLSLFAIAKTKSSGKNVNPILPYVSFMAALTVVWGILTDSWFGFSLASSVPLFASLKSEFLADGKNLQMLSFIIGLSHLTIAHLWALVIKLKSNIKAVPSEIGQMMMLFGFFMLIMNMLIGSDTFIGPTPSWTAHLIIAGLVIRLLFGEQQAEVGLGKGFINGLKGAFANVLGAVGNFSDTLSYIRLYAVGLAGFSIASSFNELALNSPVFMMPLILIFAHTLNIVLGVLGVLVHAVRLNSLEFSSHVGLTWAGLPYEPFKAKRTFIEKR